MTCFEAPSVAAVEMPARADISTVTEVGRIEAQAGDHRERMAPPGINGDPSATTAFTEANQLVRRQRLIERTGMMQRE
jgi:hypothetical protein